MREIDPLIYAYSHLTDMPRQAEALLTLQKVGSVVKPIMRKRNWHVGTLTEFWPTQDNLLGLNVDRGDKICLRLRHAGDKTQFLRFEDVVDTMLHELSHIVWGPHDHNFQKLWDELRDEHESLVRKGYTGEGFLSKGHRLGGKYIPVDEMRRQARAAAEKRRVLTKGSGQRVGGAPVRPGADMRKVIADAVRRRNTSTEGCGSGQKDSNKIADQATRKGFRTKSEEDDANNRAINQALMELIEEEEERKLAGMFTSRSSEGLSWTPQNGLSLPGNQASLASPSTGSRRPPAPPPASLHKRPASVANSSRSASVANSSRPASVANSSRPASVANSSRPSSSANASRPSASPVNPPNSPSSRPVPSLNPTPQRSGRPLSRLVAEYDTQKRPQVNSSSPASSRPTPASTSASSGSFSPATWTCSVCTLRNPESYLSCDACGVERTEESLKAFHAIHGRKAVSGTASRSGPKVKARPLGWNCRRCGTFMENQWWTCSACGVMKAASW